MINIYRSIKVYILLSYLLNIDINVDIAKFRQYLIDIVSQSKMWYMSITTFHHSTHRTMHQVC